MAGLGLGALAAGILVQGAPDPLHLVFWLLAGAFALALAAMPALPDPVPRAPRWLRSLRPEVGIPAVTRSMFVVSLPALIAAWAVAGLYLALGPSLASSMLDTGSHIAGGVVIAALLDTAAIASYLSRSADPRTATIRGSWILALGVGLTLLALLLDTLAGLVVAGAITGVGLGPAFSGVLRGLAPQAPPNRRGGLLGAVYVVVYLSFSVPTIVAGVSASRLGLRETAYGYGVVVMVLAVITALAASRQPPRTSAQAE
jgi:MFS family permease